MKLLLIALFTTFLISPSLWAQTPAIRLSKYTQSFICRYAGGPTPEVVCDQSTQLSNGHAERVVDRILKPIGLMRNFKVLECTHAENCFATVMAGQRFIVYDGAFMQRIEDETETNWSAVSIMAHEIGHHLQGHTIDGRGEHRQKELEADTFSGFVLHQLGASLEESLVAIRALGNNVATATHPAKATRISAIRKGWLDAEDMYPKWKVLPSTVPGLSGETAAVGTAPELITQFYADGKLKYQGEVKNNAPAGAGTYYFRNGDKYVGPFVNNLPNGKGTYYFADGDRFVGSFKDGKRHGYGVLYATDGQEEAGKYVADVKVD